MPETNLFGIVTTITGAEAWIAINSISTNSTIEIAEARGKDGTVCDIKPYSKKTTVSISGPVKASAASTIDAGQTLTIGAVSYIVDSVQKQETNNGFVNVTLSAYTCDAATITALSTGT